MSKSRRKWTVKAQLFLHILLNICAFTVYAQEPPGAVQNLYNKRLQSNQSILFTGVVEMMNINPGRTHQYLEKKWLASDLVYQGVPLDSISLMYNLEDDRVFVHSPSLSSLEGIPIKDEELSVFEVEEKKFINNKRYGYVESIYEGTHVQVARKHRKLRELNSTGVTFKHQKVLYAWMNEKYITIRNKGSVVRLAPEKKKEIKSLIRDHAFKPNAVSNVRIEQFFQHLEETILSL